LVRADGVKPPHGTDRLQPPGPTPAIGDVLTKASVVGSGLREASSLARLTGHTSGVQLKEFGFVDRYGVGDTARSAPRDRRLLAFSAVPTAGESGDGDPQLSVRVGDVERGPLVNTSDYVVVAVPNEANRVDLVLTDSGVKQSISLLTGVPSSGNPALAVRAIRSATLSVTKSITVRVAGPAGAGVASGQITFTGVSLSYWCADGSHPSRPDRAFMHVMATVRLDGDPHEYGVEAGLLSAAVAGGRAQKAHNAAADSNSEIDDVIEVPADIVDGTVTYSGSVATAKGHLTVMSPVTVPFRIAAS
jgi:hypothetical protein